MLLVGWLPVLLADRVAVAAVAAAVVDADVVFVNAVVTCCSCCCYFCFRFMAQPPEHLNTQESQHGMPSSCPQPRRRSRSRAS